MKGKRKFIIPLLLLINIIMLVAAVFPHHHHQNGVICMKQDIQTEEQCPCHHHHPQQTPGDDASCDGNCLTKFESPTPSVQTDNGPNYVLIATLFTEDIIEHLLRPLEKRVKNYYTYIDSLHSTDIPCTTPLRAPPFTYFVA